MMPNPETYAEYLWRERTESGGEVDKTLSNVTEKPLTSEILSKGSSSGTISFDTEIRASGTSDTLPENGCNHLWLTKAGTAYRFKFVEVCAKCGEER